MAQLLQRETEGKKLRSHAVTRCHGCSLQTLLLQGMKHYGIKLFIEVMRVTIKVCVTPRKSEIEQREKKSVEGKR